MNSKPSRKFSHDAANTAVLLLLKDGMVQKAVLYGTATTTVYVREEGRGGFGIVPTETATDFLAFDDQLTLEPEKLAAAQAPIEAENNATVVVSGPTLLAITVKTQ